MSEESLHSCIFCFAAFLAIWTLFLFSKHLFKSHYFLLYNEQCDDIGNHGTKIIIYNLWLDDGGKTELDFDTDPEVCFLVLFRISNVF